MDEMVCPVCRKAMVNTRDVQALFRTTKWKTVLCHCACGEVYVVLARADNRIEFQKFLERREGAFKNFIGQWKKKIWEILGKRAGHSTP